MPIVPMLIVPTLIMRRLVMVVMMMVVIVMLVVAVAHARAPCGSGRHRAWRHRCQSPITRELIEG